MYRFAISAVASVFVLCCAAQAESLPDEREPSMEEHWQAAETGQRLLAELHRLPDIQQQVIILRYYEELSLAEIADMLSIPLGTVKSRLRLGLEHLRQTLEVEER